MSLFQRKKRSNGNGSHNHNRREQTEQQRQEIMRLLGTVAGKADNLNTNVQSLKEFYMRELEKGDDETK